jgi:hypothetical protein
LNEPLAVVFLEQLDARRRILAALKPLAVY